MTHSEIVSFLWGIADLIRDRFRRGKYQDVILPFTVLRRIDCVLAPTKERVLERNAELEGKLENPRNALCKASGFAFYNTSQYDFGRLLDDAPNLAANLRNYIAGFSPNMYEVLQKFDFDNTISKLDETGLLFKVMERFGTVDLHPDRIPNPMMGTIFEELIRKFNEALNENPGEHFTPRDVVHLMVDLLLAGDEERIGTEHISLTVCDPCCGTGGMLTITKDHILGASESGGVAEIPGMNPLADVHLFGQEVNSETFAVCKADLFMKSADGRDGENILFGSTLSNDRHAGRHFDYQIANPPYGKDWKADRETVEAEHARGFAGRFGAGTPRISDGQLLFLQHMLAHMKEPEDGGSRVAIIMNGSPLFTGAAGRGESEIRRWIVENDWLEALIALPEQLFYNTGIATYVWVLTNRKALERRRKVQLVDATSFWSPMRKSLGDKRREIPRAKAAEILGLYRAFEAGEHVRILGSHEFGYRKVRVERPLKLEFQASPERIARLDSERAFQNLAKSRKRKAEAKAKEEAEGRELQERIRAMLEEMPDRVYRDRKEFLTALRKAAKREEIKLTAPLRKAILSALGERDEEAEVCRDRSGQPEPDTNLRDYERVPLLAGEDPADEDGVPVSVREYFEKEVQPYVPDAWLDTGYRDGKDKLVGRVGHEINFNRYFYQYEPPRPLEEIEADIRNIEGEILSMLAEVTGGASAPEPHAAATSRPLHVAERQNPGNPGRDRGESLSSPHEAYGLARKTPGEVREILDELRAGLEDLYGSRLRGMYLFGSYARGDAVAGSDLDVLVVLDDYQSSWKEIDRTSELSSSLSLEHDVTIAKVFVRESRWREGDTPFLSNARREGVPV